MPVQTTTYEVRIDYKVADQATRSLKEIADHSRGAARTLYDLRRAFYLFGGYSLMNGAKEALVGFNGHIEQSKLQLAGLLHMNIGGSFTHARKEAEGLFEQLQEDARKTPATTRELVDHATGIEDAYLRAGGSMSKFHEFTTRTYVAAKMLGMESIAQLDVQQALTTDLTIRDRFARAMLASQGINYKDFNKLDPSKRLETFNKTLYSSTVNETMGAYGETLIGASSNFKDNMEIALGKVGLPLTKAITRELIRWNHWIDENPEKIAETIRSLADGLMTAAGMIKEGVSYVVENRETLTDLAKLWLMLKGVSAVGGMAGGAAAGLRGVGLMGALAGFTNVVGLAVIALVGFNAVLNQMDKEQTNTIDKTGFRRNFAEYTWMHASQYSGQSDDPYMNRMRNVAKDVGAVKDGKFDKGAFLHALDERRTVDEIAALKQMGGHAGEVAELEYELHNLREGARMLAFNFKFLEESLSAFAMNALTGFVEGAGFGSRKPLKDRDIKVTVNKVEVSSQDPDRFVYGMMNAFRDVADNPTQAQAQTSFNGIGG